MNSNGSSDNDDSKDKIIFLDRDEERATLLQSLPPLATEPSLMILRGPTGVGKSSLTSYVTNQVADHVLTLDVDPYLRGEAKDPHRAHEGYYLQKCVMALSEAAVKGTLPGDNFDLYVKSRGWKNLKGFDAKGALIDATSINKLTKRALEATNRMMATGTHAPEILINSDDAIAVEICAEYFRHMVSKQQFIMLIRESQHIDTTSLRYILQCFADDSEFYPLMEYTAEDGVFQKRHDIQIKQFADPKIWDIGVLPWPYVTELLERFGTHDQEVVGEFKAKWNGNLRSLEEMKWRVAYGNGRVQTKGNAALMHNPVDAIKARIANLSRGARFALSLIREHDEPIAHETFEIIWNAIDPTFGLPIRHTDVLGELSKGFLSVSTAQIGLNNDDIASAITSMDDNTLYETQSRRILISHYRQSYDDAVEGSLTRVVALRHITRLAATLKDPVALEVALDQLDHEVTAKGDPTHYVSQVVKCMKTTADLGARERSALASWAARHAYRCSNFGLTVEAIEIGELSEPIWQCVLAHALIEEHREPEAREIAAELRSSLPFDGADIMSDLILGNLDLVEDKIETCKRRLEQTAKLADERNSILAGHVYRLLESAVDVETSVLHCAKSAEIYNSFGLERSSAQSRLTSTRHLSKIDRLEEAQLILEEISNDLQDTASSRQFYLNNCAAVEILKEKPDFAAAEADLRKAMLLSRDRFTDLTILQNLSITIWQSRGPQEALSAVEQMMRLLNERDTTSRLMAESAGCAAVTIYRASDSEDDAQKVIKFIIEELDAEVEENPYWSWRFGFCQDDPKTFGPNFMQKPFHPSFLSQWQLDWEVLHELFQ